MYQVVEKDSTDWHQVRYQAYAIERFEKEEDALGAAKKYLTEVNCNNSLTKEEKRSSIEAYMMIEDVGCFLGVLDGEDWYLQYPKDINRRTPKGIHTFRKGDPVEDRTYFEIQDKTEVAVRKVPGT